MTDPVRFFEINGEVVQLKCRAVSIAVGNNATVIAAVTGKHIRVMGFVAQGDGGGSKVTLKDGNAGAVLYGPHTFAHSASPAQFLLPVIDPGYFQTSLGVGLFADVATNAVNINVFYVDYAP